MGLHDVLDDPVRLRRDRLAIVEGSGTGQITYGQLGRFSDRVRDRLQPKVQILDPVDRARIRVHVIDRGGADRLDRADEPLGRDL